MKKKFLSSIFLTLVMLATVVFAASSMRKGNTDLTWGLVDQHLPSGQQGATCLRYADGPRGSNEDPTDFNGGIEIRDEDSSVQSGNTTNWNQVRYGNSCSGNPTQNSFSKQSGIAFNGIDAVQPPAEPVNYGNLEPFVLGKMCHVNNPISASNDFERTVATLKISDVDCGPGATVVDAAGKPIAGGTTNLTYTFNVDLDETSNSGTCKYPSATPCADAITPGQTSGNHLHCKYQSGVIVDYTVIILGFTPVGLNESCSSKSSEDYNQDDSMGIFISDEGATNCACVWGEISDYLPSAVEMNFFEASGADESIVLRWQTAFETDNIGFNVYRSETLIREDAVQLNQEMIASLVPPGSTFGADYEFVDESAQPYTTYFYWIEDVDVNGTITIHGPAVAEWVD